MPERTIHDLESAITEAKQMKAEMEKRIRELDQLLAKAKMESVADHLTRPQSPEKPGP